MAIAESDVLKKIPTGKSKKPSVPTNEILELLFGTGKTSFPSTMEEALDELDKKTNDLFAKQGYIKASDQALRNCHGRWSESLFAITAWNTLVGINKKLKNHFYIYVKLPPNNNKDTEWLALLNAKCSKVIKDFGKGVDLKGSAHERLTLTASNPDAVILKFPKKKLSSLSLPLDPCKKINIIDITLLNSLGDLFKMFRNKVTPSRNLVCFISIKTSTRSDRKYQYVDEGNHVKSVIMHLCATKADEKLSARHYSNRYFAISLKAVSPADYKARDCAMSAYVASPALEPLWAVDNFYQALTFDSISSCINEIISLATKDL